LNHLRKDNAANLAMTVRKFEDYRQNPMLCPSLGLSFQLLTAVKMHLLRKVVSLLAA